VTLRARLTVAFLSVVIGPVLLGALLVGGAVTAIGDDRSTYRLDLAAGVTTGAVASLCQQLQLTAELVAGHPGDGRQALADDLVARGQVAAVQVRDADGTVTVTTGRAPAASWADCREPGSAPGARSATTVTPAPDRGYGTIAARVPLRDSTGAPAGESWATHTVDDTLLAHLSAIAGVDVTVVTTDTAGPVADTIRDLAPGETGRTGDGRWVHRLDTTDGQPLPLVLVTPRSDHQELYAALLAAVLITSGLALAAAWWLARTTTRPLTELAQAADRVAEGDLTARVPVRTGDEAGQVAAAFNRMTHRTSTYVQALTASRDQLRGHLAVLGDTLSSTHDLHRILQVILQTAVTATGAAGGAVVLLDPQTRTLTGHHIRLGAEGDTVAMTVPLDGSLVGAVATTGEATRGRLRADTSVRHESEPRCQTYVIAPISVPVSTPAPPAPPASAGAAVGAAAAGAAGVVSGVPSTVRGVLAIYDRAGGDDFDDTDLVTMRTFAGQAAVAVDNVRIHEEAQRLSLTDPLTGLWNYRYLQDALRREVERAGRFGRMLTVLALDLDLFKEVNDAYGHPTGDAVLAEVALRIRTEIREVDSAFRQGGEEFVVLLPETDARGGVIVAQRLGAAVRGSPIVITQRGTGGRIPVAVTVSIGAAVFPDHGLTPDTLLGAADDALYAAKDAGRDTYRVAVAAPETPVSAPTPARARATSDPDASGGGAKPPRQSRGR
jgi:two-component system, cell cycle response regulator